MELPPFWSQPPTFQFDTRIVYLEDGAVEGDGVNAALTGKELAVFLLLALQSQLSARAYMPASQIIRYVYGRNSDYVDPHVIEVYVGNIRRKIGDDTCIICCRGKGYRLKAGYCTASAQDIKCLFETLTQN